MKTKIALAIAMLLSSAVLLFSQLQPQVQSWIPSYLVHYAANDFNHKSFIAKTYRDIFRWYGDKEGEAYFQGLADGRAEAEARFRSLATFHETQHQVID